MTETQRRPCSECGREALMSTIERNGGLCEACAKGKEVKRQSLSPRAEGFLLLGSTLVSLLVSAYVVWRCLEADWGWFWALFTVIWTGPLAFQATSFVLASLMLGYGKLRRKAPEAEGE